MSSLKKAQAHIQSVAGKPQTIEERCQKAIELAALMMQEARECQTQADYKMQTQLARMLGDPQGREFTTCMADQGFRSSDGKRVVNQLQFLLKQFGIPKFLSPLKRVQLYLFKIGGAFLPLFSAKIAKHLLQKETKTVILPGEWSELVCHIRQRQKAHVKLNINHLGEAILGEEEAKLRLETYIEDLKKTEIECVSIKISTIAAQIQLLAWDENLEKLAERLRLLYRAAAENTFIQPDGQRAAKFVNLDMEEYRDLHLTKTLFCKVLDEEEFFHFTAGIVLQAYLPDSYLLQQELTVWAMQRVAKGGAPIKIRLVKGANLAMEQVESSLRGWPQAPYKTKREVDANFKRMMIYAFDKEHAKAVLVGIGSHNLFDIAFALLLRKENGVEKSTSFEMLEGMANHIREVVQCLCGDMLLYCPVAKEREFQNAVAYLVRRLDENSAPENFLRHAFDMIPGNSHWDHQVELFSLACRAISDTSCDPRRSQNRLVAPIFHPEEQKFKNEADTDWSLASNRKWIEEVVQKFKNKEKEPFSFVEEHALESILLRAEKGGKVWRNTPLSLRCALLKEVAHRLRMKRGDLIGAMMQETFKTAAEADPEVSEAIDFVEYYRRSAEELFSYGDMKVTPKGVVVVASPWNFPCAIPCGGIAAALAAGNSVIFKPAPEAILVAHELVKAFWEAGISQEVLQFVPCDDEKVATPLVKDSRVGAVVLTGATSTAKHLLKLRPTMHLMAETGGKNAIIVTAMADRDLAVYNIVYSAFLHAGQKCSACSLAILEEEVYNDPSFKKQLIDATKSLKVGLPWRLSTQVNPLIYRPNEDLQRALTTLDEGEEWLLEPKFIEGSSYLFSPGIKIGVKPQSFSHVTEFFGPVLSVMKAKNLEEALDIANGTPYGLTSGLQTLDEREISFWREKIEAGNCYVNRTITGAIVERQPFGGCKGSSFGRGAKAGGPNYLTQFVTAEQQGIPREQGFQSQALEALSLEAQKHLKGDDLQMWLGACGSFSFFWNEHFSQRKDVQKKLGEDNFFYYKPQKKTVLRFQEKDSLLDLYLSLAASCVTGAPLEVSRFSDEEESFFIERMKKEKVMRIRLLSHNEAVVQELAPFGVSILREPVVANGRFELLNYLREVSFSHAYHRYGNLGGREKEERSRE